MTGLPPRELLVQVVESLIRHLPNQLGTLLEDDRFRDGRDALARLATPGAAVATASDLPPEEAARLTALLLDRWSLVGPVELDPAVAILGPDEVSSTEVSPTDTPDQRSEIVYEIATAGIDPDWTAEWSGPVTPTGDSRAATLQAGTTAGASAAGGSAAGGSEDPETVHIQARVFARAAGRRCVLVAERTVTVRHPGLPAPPEPAA